MPTTQDRWNLLDSWFERALAVPEDRRAAWLASSGPGDAAVRTDLERLLRFDRHAGDFLEPSAADFFGQPPTAPRRTPPAQFGVYRVLRLLGSGGMGEVYLAERNDGAFEHRVAIKQVAYPTPNLVQRFRRERQILAQLEHPHIARLIDGGVDDAGTPYLALEYVDGVPITDYVRQHALDISARLRLFAAVCDAVQYAHQNLIVHRDLKPSNIFVTDEATPKLLDFGIAKVLATGDDGAPPTATRLLTPDYAAPEQFSGQPITTATDVFGLGAVLYELLADARPPRPPGIFDGTGASSSAPSLPPPSASIDPTAVDARARRRLLRGDLDRIVMTALAHEPKRRYPSAEAFAADIRRYLDRRPIAARRDTFGYVFGKFVARNRVAAVAVALLVLVIATGVGGVLWEMHRASLQAERAENEAHAANAVKEFLVGVFKAAGPDEALGENVTAADLLDAGSTRLGSALREQTRVRAELFATLGSIDLQLGRYAAAHTLSQQGLDSSRGELAADDPLRLALELNLAESVRESNEGASLDPLPLLEHVIDVQRRLPADRQTLLIAALGARGRLMMNRGDISSSETNLREAVVLAKARGPTGLEALSRVQTDLALTLAHATRYTQAIAIYREALAARERVVDARDPGLLELRCSLADTLQTVGETKEAETILRDVLAKERQVVGPLHPLYATALNTLLNNLIMTHRFADADQLVQEGTPIWEKLYAPDSEDTFEVLNSESLLKYEEGAYTAATGLEERGLRILEKLHGADYPDAIVTRHNLALYEFRSGNLAAAQRDFERTLALRKAANEETAGALNFLGHLARLRGDADGALALHREALADAVQRESESGITTIEAHLALAQDERNLGQRDAARAETNAVRNLVPASESAQSVLVESADLIDAELDYLDGRCRVALPILHKLQPLGEEARKYWRAAEVELILGRCEQTLGAPFQRDADALVAKSMHAFVQRSDVDPFLLDVSGCARSVARNTRDTKERSCRGEPGRHSAQPSS